MKMDTHNKLDQLLGSVERIGVIGSPSTTGELSLDILGAAVGRKLVGELALFRFTQDSAPHYALGQITEVKLRNVWHEDPTMRSLIRQRGRVDAVSERRDTHLGQMIISAVSAKAGRPGTSRASSPPSRRPAPRSTSSATKCSTSCCGRAVPSSSI